MISILLCGDGTGLSQPLRIQPSRTWTWMSKSFGGPDGHVAEFGCPDCPRTEWMSTLSAAWLYAVALLDTPSLKPSAPPKLAL